MTATAEIVEDRLIVWSPKEGSELYKLGFYGKPLGIAKPKNADFDVPLTLDLIEGAYLLEKGVINVRGPSGEEVQLEELKDIARRFHEGFDKKYAVYRDLREKGYVVTPGIKYGCDFAVYQYGPGIDHAPYIVQVRTEDDEIPASEIVKAGRLATTVRKTFIIAVPNLREGSVRYLGFKWWKA